MNAQRASGGLDRWVHPRRAARCRTPPSLPGRALRARAPARASARQRFRLVPVSSTTLHNECDFHCGPIPTVVAVSRTADRHGGSPHNAGGKQAQCGERASRSPCDRRCHPGPSSVCTARRRRVGIPDSARQRMGAGSDVLERHAIAGARARVQSPDYFTLVSVCTTSGGFAKNEPTRPRHVWKSSDWRK